MAFVLSWKHGNDIKGLELYKTKLNKGRTLKIKLISYFISKMIHIICLVIFICQFYGTKNRLKWATFYFLKIHLQKFNENHSNWLSDIVGETSTNSNY